MFYGISNFDNTYSKSSARWQVAEGAYKLALPFAGYKKSDLDLSVQDSYILISAKSKVYGDTAFTCALPIKSYDNIFATLEDGILEITAIPLPVKKIPIK